MLVRAPARSLRHDHAILAGSIALLALAAAAAIWVWQASPYGRYLHHAGDGIAPALEMGLFALGWLLMIVAMMLPTTVPLVAAFAALTSRRSNRLTLVALVVLGYLAAWSTFGVAAWVADRGIHAGVEAIPLLRTYPQLVIGATLALAAGWQVSPLKRRCLDECRSPLTFVLRRWQGNAPRREAIRLGVAHGVFCIGCCWALMLVMFGVGMGNLAWMLVLGAVMAIEKNAPWGRRMTRPLAVVLVLAAIAAVST